MKSSRLERLIALSISYALGGPGSGPQGGKSITDETPQETYTRVYQRAKSEDASDTDAHSEANMETVKRHGPPVPTAKSKSAIWKFTQALSISYALGGPGSGPQGGSGKAFSGPLQTKEVEDFHDAYASASNKGSPVSQSAAFRIYNENRSSGMSHASAIKALTDKITPSH